MLDDLPLESNILTRSLNSAQQKVEERAYQQRKNLFDYDDVLNKQRNIIIITGKGTNSQGKLKLSTPLWLKSKELPKFVVGFEFMPQNKGGDGALFVKLRNKNKYKLN